MSNNLYDVLAGSVTPDSDSVFLDVDGGPTVRFGEIDAATAQIRGVLAALGVEPGDRVVIQVPKTAEAVLLYLACLKHGAIAIPLNTAYTPVEVGAFVDDAEPRVVVVAPESLAAVGPLAPAATVLTLDEHGSGTLTDAVGSSEPITGTQVVAPGDTAVILYTSGTTGRSKGAMLSHANLIANARALHEYWEFEPDDVLLHALPIFHAHGLFVALHLALLNGSRTHFLPAFDLDRIVELLADSTVFMGVPTFYTRLLDRTDVNIDSCANLRLVISGSAPLLAATWQEFRDRTGLRILERYGMTEAGMICSNPYHGKRVPGTVGFPLPGMDARVVGDDGAELPRGAVGSLEITGPNVFGGYWRMPERTAEEFRPDGYFITGDLAEMDDEGRVTLVGRGKDLVISGGFNIYPKEIELAIDALDGVDESAVIGVAHRDFGEGLTAVVVVDGTRDLDEAAVLSGLGDLARFKQPKRVFFVGELPRNTMGKVQKNLLRDQFADTYG
ncbi:MAG: AMP-binding protein [Actinomycetia bacterium]|nr:AMP-binding protein [Actinomycetes bacterium]